MIGTCPEYDSFERFAKVQTNERRRTRKTIGSESILKDSRPFSKLPEGLKPPLPLSTRGPSTLGPAPDHLVHPSDRQEIPDRQAPSPERPKSPSRRDVNTIFAGAVEWNMENAYEIYNSH